MVAPAPSVARGVNEKTRLVVDVPSATVTEDVTLFTKVPAMVIQLHTDVRYCDERLRNILVDLTLRSAICVGGYRERRRRT